MRRFITAKQAGFFDITSLCSERVVLFHFVFLSMVVYLGQCHDHFVPFTDFLIFLQYFCDIKIAAHPDWACNGNA